MFLGIPALKKNFVHFLWDVIVDRFLLSVEICQVFNTKQQAFSQDNNLMTGEMNHSNCCLNAYYQDLDQHFGIELQNINSRFVLTYSGSSIEMHEIKGLKDDSRY